MHSSKPSQSGSNGDTKRKPSRLVRAITNPDEVISAMIPQPKQPDPNAKRLEDNKFARALGGVGIDYGLGEPDKPGELPPADSPLFQFEVDATIEDKLPRGYNMRSLQRDDYDRGYTKLKQIGPIVQSAWNDRCEYMRSRPDVYNVVVITDNKDQVVATGTLLLERKFVNGMCLVGHVEDLAVGEGQSGKNLGLRLLDQLDKLAHFHGCVRTVIGTQEANEAFYKQRNFRRTGIEMTHVYQPTLKRMPTQKIGKQNGVVVQTRSRPVTPERFERERERAYAEAAARLNEPVQPQEQF